MKKHSKVLLLFLTSFPLLIILLPSSPANAQEVLEADNPDEWELYQDVLEAYYDHITVYEITLQPNTEYTEYDKLSLPNFTLVDHLPLGAEFVSATFGGTYDPKTHTVTWSAHSIPNSTMLLASADPHSFMVTLKHPHATELTRVVNKVSVEYTPFGSASSVTLETKVLHGFSKKINH